MKNSPKNLKKLVEELEHKANSPEQKLLLALVEEFEEYKAKTDKELHRLSKKIEQVQDDLDEMDDGLDDTIDERVYHFFDDMIRESIPELMSMFGNGMDEYDDEDDDDDFDFDYDDEDDEDDEDDDEDEEDKIINFGSGFQGDDRDDDSAEDAFIFTEICPKCGEMIQFPSAHMENDSEIVCPKCGQKLKYSITEGFVPVRS